MKLSEVQCMATSLTPQIPIICDVYFPDEDSKVLGRV